MECNVSELVKIGHERAADLRAACGTIAVAKLISDLTTQLDVQLARSNALAAENTGLKAEHELAVQYMEELRANFTMYKKFKCQSQSDVTTPATDAFLADVMAQGVEMFASHKRERQQALRSRSMRMSEEAAGMAADAENFADELRKGVQS